MARLIIRHLLAQYLTPLKKILEYAILESEILEYATWGYRHLNPLKNIVEYAILEYAIREYAIL